MPGTFDIVDTTQSLAHSIGNLAYTFPFPGWVVSAFLGNNEADSLDNTGTGANITKVGTPVYHSEPDYVDVTVSNYFNSGIVDPVECTIGVVAKQTVGSNAGYIGSLQSGVGGVNAGANILTVNGSPYWRMWFQNMASTVQLSEAEITDPDHWELILATVTNGPPRRATIYWPRLGVSHSVTPTVDRTVGGSNVLIGRAPISYAGNNVLAWAGIAEVAISNLTAVEIYEHLKTQLTVTI